MKNGGMIIFFVYLIFGAYFVNSAFNFVTLPEVLMTLSKWITFVGGLLIFLGGVNFLRARRERRLLRIGRERY